MTALSAHDAARPPEPLVLVDVSGRIGTLTLNLPHKRNTLSRAMLETLKAEFEALRDDAEVGVVILAAKGPVFSSGHDLKDFVGASAEASQVLLDLCTEVMELARLMPKPVIAQVQGLASAAGCQLVASCDLAVAASTAGFQTPGVKIGLFCSTPMVPISRTMSPKKMMEMLLTGEPISAEAAERAGLINRVVPPDALEAETRALARQILAYSGAVIALGKEAFYAQLPLPLPKAYEVGKAAMVRNTQEADAHEGMTAFLEKRPPQWKA